MKMDAFEFRSKSLSGLTIEDKICERCGLLYADSSNLPIQFEINNVYELFITAPNGNVNCKVIVYEKADTIHTEYLYRVSAIDLKTKKR